MSNFGKRFLLGSMFGLAFLGAGPASSSVVFYTSESAFDAALSARSQTDTISSAQASTSYSTASGFSEDGVTIVGITNQGYSLYGVPGGADGYDYPVNSLQGPPTSSGYYGISGGYDTLTFAPGVTAFGARVFTVHTYDYEGSYTDTLNLTVDGLTGTATSASGSGYSVPGSGFIGFISTGPVTSATLSGTGYEDFVDIAQITVGASAPEPAIWALLLAGFGLVGAALRSTRRGRAPIPARL